MTKDPLALPSSVILLVSLRSSKTGVPQTEGSYLSVWGT
jgi:hypothetical protein